MTSVLTARFEELDVHTLYALVRLRLDVFVVEQVCVYLDLDGRDTEPTTVHIWTADDVGPTSYLRLLFDEADIRRIGRVCTRADARGLGLAAELITAALVEAGDAIVVLDAQSYLHDWYARFGFTATGPEFLEDGIPHIPMRRAGGGGG